MVYLAGFEPATLRVGVWAIDLICGKQVTVTDARGHQKFTVFTPEIQEAIRRHTANGGNVIVSGSYIGTDIWDMVYPIQIDKDFRNQSIDFAEDVLGYKWQGGFAGKNGMVSPYGESSLTDKSVKFCNTQNSVNYCIESPDGIAPASNNSQTVLRYGDSGVSAGIKYQGNGYKTVCLGFPIETLQSKDDIDAILASILTFLADR